jgi:hypothetical protein
VALVFVPYLFNPAAMAELRFNLIDVSAAYVRGEPLLGRVVQLCVALPPALLLTFMLIGPWLSVRLRDKNPSETMRALLFVLFAVPAVFLGGLPGQAKPHYVIPSVALMALAVTGSLGLGRRRTMLRDHMRLTLGVPIVLAALYVAVQLPLLASYYRASADADPYLTNDRRRFDLDGLVAYIGAHTRADAAIWVYFDAPEVYMLSDRRPATRDPGGAYLSLYWDEPWFERTASELAAEQPELIVGITKPRYKRPQALPVTEIPRVGDYVKRTYDCDPDKILGTIICTRIAGGRS